MKGFDFEIVLVWEELDKGTHNHSNNKCDVFMLQNACIIWGCGRYSEKTYY